MGCLALESKASHPKAAPPHPKLQGRHRCSTLQRAPSQHQPNLSRFLKFPCEDDQVEKPTEHVHLPLPHRTGVGTRLQSRCSANVRDTGQSPGDQLPKPPWGLRKAPSTRGLHGPMPGGHPSLTMAFPGVSTCSASRYGSPLRPGSPSSQPCAHPHSRVPGGSLATAGKDMWERWPRQLTSPQLFTPPWPPFLPV